jgi:hypothetical protein
VQETLAWARFFRTLGAAATQLAADLTLAAQQGETPSFAAASPEALVSGTRQKAIVGLAGLRQPEGMKTAEVAQATGRTDIPNVQIALRALERRGLLELVPNRLPQHWRFVERYREESSTATAHPNRAEPIHVEAEDG